ncbi:unnamed protein product [Soboliphyme baturini]|uniref:Replication protein A 70 kDa DNA-binding subunit n=1 Tax=Soboliphyme baturini TaxID=241478 RepID=A0A183IRZ7_9BILA|nr:unnamed protein product [Soboliphyme baturini]
MADTQLRLKLLTEYDERFNLMTMPSVQDFPPLTPNAVEMMLNQQMDSDVTVQVLQYKKLSDRTPNQPPRYRLQISDGEHSCGNCMLATQKNELIESGQLDSFAIVSVKKYISNKISNKKFVVLVELEVLKAGSTVVKPIGNPTPLKELAARTTPPSTANTTQEFSRSIPSSTSSMGQESLPPSSAVPKQQSFPATTHASSHTVCPIMALTPYQHKWCILARLTMKSNIKTWSNSRGEGKLFSVNLADESGEIRATGFNQECDRLYNVFQLKQVYYISYGQVKTANRQFTSIANDYEIAFTSETQVEACFDDTIYRLPTMSFNFSRFDQLSTVNKDRLIGLI